MIFHEKSKRTQYLVQLFLLISYQRGWPKPAYRSNWRSWNIWKVLKFGTQDNESYWIVLRKWRLKSDFSKLYFWICKKKFTELLWPHFLIKSLIA